MSDENARKKVMAIVGSTRTNSTNELFLAYLGDVYYNTLDITIFKGIASLPHFNPDLDTDDVSSPVKAFRDQIAATDGVIICTPEYVFSIPGALKNALEWTVSTTVFLDKPTAVIVASGLGEKTFESLTLVMRTLGSRIGDGATLLIQGTRGKFDAQGKLVDQKTKESLDILVRSFLDTMTAPV